MPNWCINNLVITGDKKELKKFVKEAKSKEKDISFSKLYPIPKELEETSSPAKIVAEKDYEKEVKEVKKRGFFTGLPMTKKTQKEVIKKYGFDNWYDWCRANWGTKWDLSNVEVEYEDDEYLEASFDTAWCPPLEAFDKISKDYPNLHFRLKYEEEGCGFMGVAKFENGQTSDQCIDL